MIVLEASRKGASAGRFIRSHRGRLSGPLDQPVRPPAELETNACVPHPDPREGI